MNGLGCADGTVARSFVRSLATLAAVLALSTSVLAHEDPPGCFQTGPAIVISVVHGDGSPLIGSVSSCEPLAYRATLKKALDSDSICAFSGGAFRLMTPDGVLHDIDLDVPCIGGTTAPCDSTV